MIPAPLKTSIASSMRIAFVAFHPHLPLLGTIGGFVGGSSAGVLGLIGRPFPLTIANFA